MLLAGWLRVTEGSKAAADVRVEAAADAGAEREDTEPGRDVEIGSEGAVASLLTTFWWPVVYIIQYGDAMGDTGLSEPCGREPQTLTLSTLSVCGRVSDSYTPMVNVKISSLNGGSGCC